MPIENANLGRLVLYTDYEDINEQNIEEVVSLAWTQHQKNVQRINWLFDYEKGDQPINERIKPIRSDHNTKVCVNKASQIVDFHTGYLLSNPITYVQRARVEDGKTEADGKADDTKVDFKVDGKKYELVDKENISIEVPKDFKETDVIYKKKKISGYASPNKLVKIICLKNDKDEQAWFIVGNNDSISKYVEHKGSNLRLIFTEKPENVQVPKGFSAKKIDIDKNSSDVYVSDKDNSFYLVYAINLDDQEGWYLYDSLEGTYVRYADISENEVKATPDEPKTIIVEKTVPAQEKGFFTKKTLKKLIWVMAGMFIALCILCIVLFFINNNLSKKLKKAERSLKGGKNSDKGKGSNKESKESKKDSKKENKKEKNAQQNGEEIVSKAVIPAEGTEVSEETNEAEAYDNYADESEYADNNVEYNDGQAYDNNPEYSEEGYTEGDYSEEGYSEDGYAEGQEYSDEGYSEEGYSEDNYEAESDAAAVYNYDQNYQDEYAGEDGAYSDSEYSEDGDGEYYSEEEYADSAVSEAEYETYDDAVLDEADYQEEVSEQDGYTGNASFERNIPNAGDTGYFENPFNITRKAEKPSVSYSFKQYDSKYLKLQLLLKLPIHQES